MLWQEQDSQPCIQCLSCTQSWYWISPSSVLCTIYSKVPLTHRWYIPGPHRGSLNLSQRTLYILCVLCTQTCHQTLLWQSHCNSKFIGAVGAHMDLYNPGPAKSHSWIGKGLMGSYLSLPKLMAIEGYWDERVTIFRYISSWWPNQAPLVKQTCHKAKIH